MAIVGKVIFQHLFMVKLKKKMVKKKKEKEKKGWWYWILLLIVILIILNSFEGNKEENCNLTFNTYTYNEGCATACSIKCTNEDFEYASSSYFEPYLSYEEMIDTELYKRCECNCEGCRK